MNNDADNIASFREYNTNFNAVYGQKYFTMNKDADNAASFRDFNATFNEAYGSKYFTSCFL